ncbi:multi-sensor signal transduction multi-kinase [Chryseotalea sanaruensis]|uniref:histidine kinase n=1 Tax=Chryseotalea sanaruensis TaxID=2482724 RepID=A0A401UDE4_9BACT|nr:sensor histidine kinase [Chryseotalea sanaruensis]GCC52925.1 multi-sensor signal transduction multi-kinase [Chryseotalea sanaruensis]
MARCVYLLLFFFLPICAYAQELIPYQEDDGVIVIGNKANYVEDQSKNLTIKDFEKGNLNDRFITFSETAPNFGNTTAAIWSVFTIDNKTNQILYLEFRKTLADKVDFIYRDSLGQLHTLKTGNFFDRDTRDVEDNFFIFRLPPSRKPVTYYLRVESTSNISFPLSLATGREMFTKHRDEELGYGLFLGIILTLVIYNLFILFTVREKIYAYYVAYLLVSIIGYDVTAMGFGSEYLWGNLGIGIYINTINHVLISSVMIFVLFFISSFLDLPKKLPALYKSNLIVITIGFILIALQVLLNNIITTSLIKLFSVVISLYGLGGIAYAYAKGLKPARLLLIGWTFYIISLITYLCYIVGLLPYVHYTTGAPMYGIALEALLFSFALADRIRELRQEKMKAQLENLQLIKHHNEVLEKTVYERTLEITAQNEEIQAQNEELVTLQDQLSLQNESLENQNLELQGAWETIDQQNDVLRQHTENLEVEVKKKASDLFVSNQELVNHNNQLQQFSFITAHNLRSPVARILGLINLLHVPSVDDQERQHILNQIQKTGYDLDQVIKDLSVILDIKKGLTENYEAVPIKSTLFKVTSLLQTELERNNVQLSIEVDTFDTIIGIPAYLESVFFNLLSNAIKYRSPERLPHIQVQAKKDNDLMTIAVKDNGIGIDLASFAHKLFGMYQRFHFHTEGKGLGLHLVKTQVESMGGKISVESHLNVGTTFIIELAARR